MLVALAYHPGDQAQSGRLLDWIGELDGKLRHELLLVSSSGVLAEDSVAMLQRASSVFDTVYAIHQNRPEETGWPTAANAMFRLAHKWVCDNANNRPWLWIESDCVPMRSGWLDEIETEYRRGGKAIMGTVFRWPKIHINGVAVYRGNLGAIAPGMVSISNPLPFDVACADVIMGIAHRTRLIQRSLPAPRRGGWTFDENTPYQTIVWDDAALFHGCKDGSLIEVLRCESPKPKPVSTLPPPVEKPKSKVREILDAVFGLKLSDVTLVVVDTVHPNLALKAVNRSMSQCSFGDVLFFTDDDRMPYAVKTPHLCGLQGYCDFLIRKVPDYIKTTHALIIQWDGYVLDRSAWKNSFLQYDYIGAPSDICNDGVRRVGNGGFSLRSKKLMEACRKLPTPYCPEDQIICYRHWRTLVNQGFKFAPEQLADQFSCEIWDFTKHFGFHSFQTPIPDEYKDPTIYHHTGDVGDMIYSLPAIAANGSGVLFMSDYYKGPLYPSKKPTTKTVESLSRLFELQPYLWQLKWTKGVPKSVDYDFNEFRRGYTSNSGSLMAKQLAVCNAEWPQDKPWLTVDCAVSVPERPIIVNRTPRYRNNYFQWGNLVKEFGSQMAFVGLQEEYAEFVSEFGYMPHVRTNDFLELARVIAGSKAFIGNQSSPLALAIGLGQNVMVEVFDKDPNCCFDRDNALYPRKAEDCILPEKWIS